MTDYKRYPYHCCGYLTMWHPGACCFDICAICRCEDDNVQLGDPDFTGGANEVDPVADIKWDWVPNERVGPISFGAPINEYIADLSLREIPDKEAADDLQKHYEVPGAGVDVYVVDNRVDWVRSEEVVEFRGKNLIGATEKDVEALFGGKADEREEFDLSEDDDEPPYVALDYSALNVQVWMFKGRVESVSCSHDEKASD
ncbi:CPCC family cysteine-rich protein [Denitrobaculum tricleocarpae]|uniref:Cysteine-rich CPCC domain-containing protein n=1 Tax=Denitrobaculum tricleocarpae TaxID=2591009 RepID=A0A545TUE2_9PROT|nr:CPCC family cysteine-rich protein [Denitrobaculum tricleocarpae]TQV80781.1 hypothetical protein FKG95_11560 [Denitrobaculum tricleocarpae]